MGIILTLLFFIVLPVTIGVFARKAYKRVVVLVDRITELDRQLNGLIDAFNVDTATVVKADGLDYIDSHKDKFNGNI